MALAQPLTGTHRGEFRGHVPTGGDSRVRGVQISRFEDRLLAERWGSRDQLGMTTQLGLA